MKRNFTREEIEELIFDLGSDDQEVIDLAMSALLMSNPRRHLSDMIDALKWAEDIVKQRICYIFGGMIDERCIDPLLIMLSEANIDTKLAAIDSLQYFPVERILPHLIQQLKHDDEDVRDAVIFTLGVFIKHGVIDAHVPLIDIIRDENEAIELRRSALLNLQHLDEDDLVPVLDSLKEISDASIYSHILLLQDGLGKDREQRIAQVERLVQKLISEKEPLKQIRLEDRLVGKGSLAAKILMTKIFEDPDNTPVRVHARMIIDKMGSKAVSAYKWLFETFDRFDDLMQVILFQDMITVIAQRKYSALAKPMVALLRRMNNYIEKLDAEEDRREFDHIKADIHFALATYGCHDAIDDMKGVMKDGTERQNVELIRALAQIGDKDFLIPLINQFQVYRNFKRPSRIVKQAFKAIVRREKIKRTDPLFDNLSELQKENLGLIMKR